MRALVLVLLILINSFSLPLQAMNSHVMSANIPCNMQAMSEMMVAATDVRQHSSDAQRIRSCQPDDIAVGDKHSNIMPSDCDMSATHCSSTNSLAFISINHLMLTSSGQIVSILPSPVFLPEQHPESLYRPPLIV